MPEIDLNDTALKGVVRDTPAYQIPPEAWTIGLNMRNQDGSMSKMLGWTSIFGAPPVAPHYTVPILTPSQVFWLYASLSKIYVYDGSSHTNITRQLGGADEDYHTQITRELNGTIFAGIPIINNGQDIPQFWGAYTPGTKMANLLNWPEDTRAAVIRSLGAYLIAIHITKGGSVYPHLVKWSSEATDPGTLPGSWDEADETVDAGEYDLPDVNSGLLQEALPLATKMFLYKDESTWSMRFIGGRAVFAFDPFLETSGILAPRCVAITGDSRHHVVATQDDIIIHNGSGVPASIVDKKLRREIFAAIDTTHYRNSFIYTDPEYNEVVFAFPESGNTHPNRGLVFNYKTGILTEMDGITYRNAAIGRVEAGDGLQWNTGGSDTWNGGTGAWNTQAARQLVFVNPNSSKFYRANIGTLRDGATYTSTLQREGLSVVGRKRNGEWIVNHQIFKFIDRIWPKVVGGTVQIRIGIQDTVDGPITWRGYESFNPTTDVTIDSDPPISGRAVAVEVTATADAHWKLDGYRINVVPDGEH